MSKARTTTSGGLDLHHADLAKPPLNIPNSDGRPFKTELVLVRTPEQTVKINWWHAPDDDRPSHNHPWDFESEILHGGYTEVRWRQDDTGHWHCDEYTHRAGDTVYVPRNEYHTVIAVEPGTVTRMTCGPARPGNEWGYLDTHTGVHTSVELDPDFIRRLRACNSWMPAADPFTALTARVQALEAWQEKATAVYEQHHRATMLRLDALERAHAGHTHRYNERQFSESISDFSETSGPRETTPNKARTTED
jgi:hypothetical protein